jgi:2-methylaconitate cis-trans-isomerase PrpF
VFFCLQDLPEAARQPGAARDAPLLRVIGSPDPYGKQIDGMGGATSSTSTVIISSSSRLDYDVGYLFGQVSIDSAFVDWSGNCGNLSAAVGPFAIASGCIEAARIPENGTCTVRIWQANIGKTPIFNSDQLGELGFGIVLYANAALEGAVAGMQKALTALRDEKEVQESSGLATPLR